MPWWCRRRCPWRLEIGDPVIARPDTHPMTVRIDHDTVRAGATVLATLAAAVFVQAHGALRANWLQHAHGLNGAIFPLPTAFYRQYALAGYLLPLVAAWLGVVAARPRAGSAVRFEIALRAIGLLALLWVLGAILAWELPLYYSIEIVR